jgi:hypothetical protein
MVHIGINKDLLGKDLGTGNRTHNVNGHGDPVRALSIAPFCVQDRLTNRNKDLRDRRRMPDRLALP